MKQLLIPLILIVFHLYPQTAHAQKYLCEPTPADHLGPYYQPNAPQRSQTGSGYLLTGEVKSALTCTPISGAMIEVWMAGPDGQYSDKWRATLFADKDGNYRFSSPYPGDYGGRPPHIHMIISAPGFRKLTTQHYPGQGAEKATFDINLMPRK